MTNLNATVSTLREIARDGLRMDLISARRSKITSLNAEKDSLNRILADYKLDIATSNYEMAAVPTDHPRKADKVKEYTDAVEYVTKRVKETEEALTAVDARIKEQDEGISKLESGETKVSMELLESNTARLIKVVTDKAASDAAPTVSAPVAPKKA